MKTRNWRIIGSMALMALFAWGCASSAHIEKDPSANFAAYRTYAWAPKPDTATQKSRNSDLLEKNMKMAVTRELDKIGLRENRQRPDILLDYEVQVDRTTKTRSESVYSQPTFRPFYNPYTRRWGTIYYPSQYLGQDNYPQSVNEGTVTITMIDARTDKTIWQGWTTDEINSRYMTAKDIESSVAKIMKKYQD